MRTRTTAKVLIAALSAVLLIALSAVVLVEIRRGGEAPGLATQFRAVDAAYQRATKEFVHETQGLQDAALRTALGLYGVALAAARAAQTSLEDLEVVDETARPTERMTKALQVTARWPISPSTSRATTRG